MLITFQTDESARRVPRPRGNIQVLKGYQISHDNAITLAFDITQQLITTNFTLSTSHKYLDPDHISASKFSKSLSLSTITFISGRWPSELLQLAIMTRTLANVLSTALDRTYHFPFLDPSIRNVRSLFDALEDLVLPLGSLPSEDLRPWAPTDQVYDSNAIVSPRSTTLLPGSMGSQHDGDSRPPKPTLGEAGVEHLSSAPPTRSTFRTVRPRFNVMRSSALPKRNDSGSAPGKKSASAGRKSIYGQSNAAFKSALATSTHGDHAKVPLSEQTVTETNTLSNICITMSEEGQDEQQDEDSTAVVKGVSTGSQTTKQQDGDSTAAVEEVSMGTLVLFENAIRELVDPEGTSGPDLQKLAQLVADIMKQRTEAEENSRPETVRPTRAEEDLRHWWEDKREVFERIISGQNIALQLSGNEKHELAEENRKLKLEHSVDEEKRKDILEDYNTQIRTLKAENLFAEETAKTAKTAKAKAEDRIDVLIDDYESTILAAEENLKHVRNSLIFSKRAVRNAQNGARREINVAVEEHQVVIKDKDRTIQELEATIKHMREEPGASGKRHLEKQLEDQRKEKDREIGALTDQLRNSKTEVKSLSGWKDTAEAEKQNRTRLAEKLQDQTTRFRKDKKQIVDQKSLDIRRLERTIKTKEANISRLELIIISLEAGEEIEGLKSQLEESKKQLQVSAKNMQDLEQQLQNCQRETEELKNTIKARDKSISEEAEKASLEKALKQTNRVSEEGLKEKVRELGEQKDDLARKLEIAQNAEQTVRTHIKRLNDENGQTAAEHKKTIKEMNEEIQCLQLNAQNYENQKKSAVENVGNIIEEAKGKIGELERDKAAMEKAVEEAAESVRQTLQKQLDDERQSSWEAQEKATCKIGELERDKAAMEKAAEEAAESVRQTLQKQLDDERQSSRVAQEKATRTENELRNEAGVLRSQLNNVEKSHSTDPAGSEAGKEAQIAEELFKQADDANNLLLEIGANGLAKKSVEQTVLCQLNEAKIALHRVKCVLLEPPARYHRARLVKMLDGVNVNEEGIAQLPIDSALVSQAKMANARLLRLEKILDANVDVQRDAMLEALHTATPFEREIRKPRALKRPAKLSPPSNPSTGGQTEVSMGQSQQTNGAPEHTPIFNLHQIAQPQVQATTLQDQMQASAETQTGVPTNGPVFRPDTKVAFDFTSVGGAPAAANTPLSQPFGMVDAGTGGPSSTDKPIKRDHRPPFMDLLNSLKPAANNNISGAMPAANAPLPVSSLQGGCQTMVSVGISKNYRKNQTVEMPEGWTDEMTGTVRGMHGEDNLFISEMVKELHGLQVKDHEGLDKWLNKLQADHEAEMNPPNA